MHNTDNQPNMASAQDQASSNSETMPTSDYTDPADLYELKQQAIQYYNQNGIPVKMEEILNSMFYDKPNDVFGYVANYFESLAATPTVSKVQAVEVLDSKGQPTLQTDVYCIIKNNEKCLGSSVMSNVKCETDIGQGEKEAEDAERLKSLEAAIGYIQTDITNALSGTDPTRQEEVDSIVYNLINSMYMAQKEQEQKDNITAEDGDKPPSPNAGKNDRASASRKKSAGKGKKGAAPVVINPDEPKEKLFSGCNAVCGVSQSLCKAGAYIKGKPLYKHIACQKNGEIPPEILLPVPMVTILTAGQTSLGKLNGVKDFMILPKPEMPYSQSVRHITSIYNHVCKSLVTKAGPKSSAVAACLVTDTGSLYPTLDRIEQGLDIIQEAITATGLTPGQDFYIALDLAAHEIFDYEKGKYEIVAGMQKLPEDLADFWSELIGRYPSVVALIDPTRKADKEAWMKLSEKISEKCLIAGDVVYHRPELLKDEELTNEFQTSAIVLRLQEMSTITDVIKASKKMEEAEKTIILSTNVADTTDTVLADLAVGVNCRYIKLGAPCRGERTVKLNRLLQIEAELLAEGTLGYWAAQKFPLIKAPTPPSSVNGDENGECEKKSDKSESKKK